MIKLKYCIMDMDGTLVDSMPYWNRLTPDYLMERGFGLDEDMDALMCRIKTMTMPEACVFLKEKFGLPEEPQEIHRAMDQVMRGHYEKDIPIKKGVRETLDALRENGAELCVLTATALPLVHLCLQRLEIESCFSFVMSCEEVGRGKEYPDAFLEAARRLKARPEEIAVFEDSASALRTARRAGFYTVAVYDPFSGDWEQCLEEADEVITDWTQS